jgi:hypothetical protein
MFKRRTRSQLRPKRGFSWARCGSSAGRNCRGRGGCGSRSWCGICNRSRGRRGSWSRRGQSIRSLIGVNRVHPGIVYLRVERSVNCPTIGRNIGHGYGQCVDNAGGINIDLFLAATEGQSVSRSAACGPLEGNG